MTKARSNSIAPAAKGELQVGNGSLTSGILSVGSNDQVLTADSTASTGLKWAAPTANGLNFSSIANTSFNQVQTLTFSSLSSSNIYRLYLHFTDGSANSPSLTINGDTGANYRNYMQGFATGSSTDNGAGYITNENSATIARKWGTTGQMIIEISGVGTSGRKSITSWAVHGGSNGYAQSASSYNSSSTVTSFALSFGTNTTGTYILLGA